jgi:hypothetical protein
MANITASSQRSPLQYSRKDYLMLGLSANQDSNIALTNPIKFNTRTAGNMTFNPATYQVTLKANKTYALKSVHFASFSNANAFLTVRFYNVTAGAYISTNSSTQYPLSYATQYSGSCAVFDIITPTVDSVIECRIASVYNLTAIYSGKTFWEITEIDTYTPAVYGGQYAYVSPPILLTVTGTNYVSVRAVGIFYKTTDGTWRMTFNLTGTMTATNSILLTIAGVVFKNTTDYYQSVSSHSNANTVYNTHAYCNPNAGTIQYTFSNNTGAIRSSGDVELDLKPTVAGIPSDV